LLASLQQHTYWFWYSWFLPYRPPIIKMISKRFPKMRQPESLPQSCQSRNNHTPFSEIRLDEK
jgi:hypothetical protein